MRYFPIHPRTSLCAWELQKKLTPHHPIVLQELVRFNVRTIWDLFPYFKYLTRVFIGLPARKPRSVLSQAATKARELICNTFPDCDSEFYKWIGSLSDMAATKKCRNILKIKWTNWAACWYDLFIFWHYSDVSPIMQLLQWLIIIIECHIRMQCFIQWKYEFCFTVITIKNDRK